MKRQILKKLIKEVIRETEAVLLQQQNEQESEKEPTAPDIGMKHSLKHSKEYGGLSDTIVQLKLKGINKGNVHIIKDFIAQAAYDAKVKDLEVINAEIQKQGKSVLSIDEPELKGMSKKEKETAIDKELSKEPVDPDAMTPEERLAMIKPGEKAAEWQALTKLDMEKEKAKAAQRADLEKKNQLKKDPSTGLPEDPSLWTDREWDVWNAQNAPQIYSGGKSVGKYRPNLSKKTAHVKKAAVPANFSQTIKR